MEKVLQANFKPDVTSLYNINRVDICIWDKVGGVYRPRLYNYQELSPSTAILRSSTHEGDKEVFDIYSDKQTVPNILASFAMNLVFSSNLWTQNTMDEILNIGEKLYEKSREEILKNEIRPRRLSDQVEEEEVVEEAIPERVEGEEDEFPEPIPVTDDVIIENVIKEYKIGINKFIAVPEKKMVGVFEEEYRPRSRPRTRGPGCIKRLLNKFLDTEGEEVKQALIKSEALTVGVWREDGVFYLFDPKGRDHMGMAIGRELWSAKIYRKESFGEEGEGKDYDEGKK